jgi:hypothetical protein
MRIDETAGVSKLARIAEYLTPKRAMSAEGKYRATHLSVGRHHRPDALRLSLVTLLVLMIAIAPAGRASAETLEIPQAAPSPLPADQAAQPPDTSPSANSSGEIAAGSAANYEAQSAPTSTAQARPMPQVAGIDQYMNQDGRGSGNAPRNVPDPRNNRSSSGGAILVGGLMVGLIGLGIALSHHR